MRSEQELLDAWRGGDNRAGNDLFDLHARSLYRFFASKLGPDVSDLVQDTFLACVRSRERLREGSSFRAYLFTVARSRLYNHLTRTRPRAEALDFGVTSIRDLRTSPVTALARQKLASEILQAMEELPIDLQGAVELYYFEEMSARELAVVFDVPEGTIRSWLRRARELLQEKVSAELRATHLGSDEALADWAARVRARASE